MKPYVSLDIESTGLDDESCQILEVGAVIDDWKTSVEELPTFRCYVDHGQFVGEPYALSMHPKIFRYIATSGKESDEEITILTPNEVAEHFFDWLIWNDLHPLKHHLTMAGKNYSSMDRNFLRRLPRWTELIKTQHRSIDPGNLYWDPTVDTQGLPSTKTCMERAGIDGEVAHTAVEDAIVVVKLVRYWYDKLCP
jgi:oligoribonuclease (3'-5' exoribonuclease)